MQIDEILITLPYGFVHLVEKPTDLQLMNEASVLDVHSDERAGFSIQLPSQLQFPGYGNGFILV